MREKKYRVWAGGKMHFPDIITFDAQGASFCPADSGGGACRVAFFDVAEPTGFKDANGAEIYESDILRDDDGMAVASWDFQNGEWGYYLVEEDGTFPWSDSGLSEWAGHCSIVGNLLANRDLLE